MVSRRKGKAPLESKEVEDPVFDDDDDDDDDEEEGDDEYVVEEIIDHQFYEDGMLHYLVKWKGYEKKSDRTWEPTENLAYVFPCPLALAAGP